MYMYIPCYFTYFITFHFHQSITADPENPSIKVEYANTTLKPGNKYTKVAVLVFSVGPHPQSTDPDISGIIKIWAEDKASFHQLTVPYEAQVLPGSAITIVLVLVGFL